MDNFDNLLKQKIEGKTHEFQQSHWNSFCSKAGINPAFSSFKIYSIVSSSVAVATLTVVAIFYFTRPVQPVLTATPEEIFQTILIDTCDTELVILPDTVEVGILVTQKNTPIKRENNPKNETELLLIIEQKTENPPKTIEYIRPVEMRVDTIKSDNQLRD